MCAAPGSRVVDYDGLWLADIRQLPLPDETLDSVLCTRVLSHVDETDLDRTIREFARALTRGGAVLLTDIHPDHPYRNTGIPVYGRKVTIRSFKHSRERLLEAAESAGLEVVSYQAFSVAELPARDVLSLGGVRIFEQLAVHPGAKLFYRCILKRAR